ncbi:predicted protein [Streptomyces albidoflavus]|nr:predicted protein [Streptomyces albidoflavus]
MSAVRYRSRRRPCSGTPLTRLLVCAVALSMTAGLGLAADQNDRLATTASSGPAGSEAPGQVRQDQCLLSDALRIGGESMATVGQDGLNQTAEKLREAANREY